MIKKFNINANLTIIFLIGVVIFMIPVTILFLNTPLEKTINIIVISSLIIGVIALSLIGTTYSPFSEENLKRLNFRKKGKFWKKTIEDIEIELGKTTNVFGGTVAGFTGGPETLVWIRSKIGLPNNFELEKRSDLNKFHECLKSDKLIQHAKNLLDNDIFLIISKNRNALKTVDNIMPFRLPNDCNKQVALVLKLPQLMSHKWELEESDIQPIAHFFSLLKEEIEGQK